VLSISQCSHQQRVTLPWCQPSKYIAACRTDAELRDTMIKVEESIDAGKLKMKPEVRAGTIVK
jgi:hypothetical protein